MNYHSTKNKLRISTRGIMTISVIASFMSLPLVEYIHHSHIERRMMMNINYNGEYGGEILIPALIMLVGVVISLRMERKRDEKYKKL